MKFSVIITLLTIFISGGTLRSDTLHVSSSFGEFTDASSISSSMGEFVFVADIGTSKIYKYNVDGTVISSYGGTGIGANALNQPMGIDASNGLDVYICDYLNNRLVRLDYKLNFISFFDFKSYNSLREVSNKLFNPKSIAVINTGELFLLCDAGNYKVVKLREFSSINQYFGQVQDRLIEPAKIIRGSELDVWILDKSSNELLNYTNLGIFVKRLSLPDLSNPVSIAYSEKKIFILYEDQIYVYDLVKGSYAGVKQIPGVSNPRDLNIVDKETILILNRNKVLKIKFKL